MVTSSTAEKVVIHSDHSDSDPEDVYDAPSGDDAPVSVEGVNLGNDWEQSFIEHQLRQQESNEAAVEPPVVVPSAPSQQSDLTSDHLHDLLELEEFSAATWPAGLDARIARIILRDRRG